jgi:hypothetical protein
VQSWSAAGAKTTFATPAGGLPYGTQVAFTVTTVNDKGGSSKASPMSNSVVPYTVPDKPLSLHASTGATAGTVDVAWAAPQTNGRPITKYTVKYGTKTKDVTGGTSVQLTGLTAGAKVSVSVVAVNAAGTSPLAGPITAQTIAKPTVTITGHSVGYNSISVSFTVNDGGGSATCNMAVSGEGTVNGSCSNITYNGLAPGLAYTATVTVKNQVTSTSQSVGATTTALSGTVHCVPPAGDTYCSGGIGIYSYPAQQNQYAITQTYSGTRFQAYCKKAGGANTQEGTNSTYLNAAKYNSNKYSNMWVKIATTNRYIPWVWFNLDAGDDLNNLPTCK